MYIVSPKDSAADKKWLLEKLSSPQPKRFVQATDSHIMITDAAELGFYVQTVDREGGKWSLMMSGSCSAACSMTQVQVNDFFDQGKRGGVFTMWHSNTLRLAQLLNIQYEVSHLSAVEVNVQRVLPLPIRHACTVPDAKRPIVPRRRRRSRCQGGAARSRLTSSAKMR